MENKTKKGALGVVAPLFLGVVAGCMTGVLCGVLIEDKHAEGFKSTVRKVGNNFIREVFSRRVWSKALNYEDTSPCQHQG